MVVKVRTKSHKPRLETIEDAAIELFYEQGYHATGMRQIAEKVGVTQSNLYNFFPSKQNLLFFILKTVMSTLITGVKTQINSTEDPIIQLKKAMEFHIQFHGEQKKKALISDSELRGLEDHLLEEIKSLRSEYENIFIQIIERGNDKVNSATAKITVNAILSMCTGVSYWYRSDGELTLSDIADKYFSIIADGLPNLKSVE